MAQLKAEDLHRSVDSKDQSFGERYKGSSCVHLAIDDPYLLE